MSETTQEDTNETLHEGKRLQEYLNAQQITQVQLAKRLKLSPQAVHHYFSKPILAPRILKSLLAGLNASYEEVFELPLQQVDLLPEGYLLKAYLIRHRISQTWLAEQLGIGNNTISRYMQNVSFHGRTLDDILKALGANYEQVFGQGAHKPSHQPIAPVPVVSESPMDDHTQQETSLSLLRRHLNDWQAQRDRLQARGASGQELLFCQYQIWHLELSLPALGLSGAVNSSNSINP